MVEMLICVVCIGLLTIAVTSFHTLLNNQMIKMQDREVAALLEYSDLSRLREKNVIDDDFRTPYYRDSDRIIYSLS